MIRIGKPLRNYERRESRAPVSLCKTIGTFRTAMFSLSVKKKRKHFYNGKRFSDSFFKHSELDKKSKILECVSSSALAYLDTVNSYTVSICTFIRLTLSTSNHRYISLINTKKKEHFFMILLQLAINSKFQIPNFSF